MHVLTKIFVVIASIASIALSTLVIAYAVNTDRIAADYRTEQHRRLAADSKFAAQATAHSAEQNRLNEQLATANRQVNDLQDESRRLQSQIATLTAEKNRAELERQSVQAKIAELGETARTQAALITKYSDEVRESRATSLQRQKQQLELEERVSDLQSRAEVLEQDRRALQEQLAEAKRAQEAALSGVARGEDKPFVYTGPAITGRIDEVRADPATGRTLVKINVGTNDRVAKNMQFLVGRGPDWLANLVVTSTDLQFAVAEVTLKAGGKDLRVGDVVSTRFGQ